MAPVTTSTACMQEHEDPKPTVFDFEGQSNKIPTQFVWPDEEKPRANAPELHVPLINLGGFLSGDPEAAMEASRLVGEACEKHGFFLVVNHGVDSKLVSDAYRCLNEFFELPLQTKQRAQRHVGEHCGYSCGFTGRFSSKPLPWKETLTFRYSAEKNSNTVVQDYLRNKMGEEFEELGYD